MFINYLVYNWKKINGKNTNKQHLHIFEKKIFIR
jgi:hypothetical protein